MSALSLRRPDRKDWWPDFTGQTVLIAASGPSQNKADLDFARGKVRVVAVGRTWELCPWADVLYSGDRGFWETYRPEFRGLRVSGDRPFDDCKHEPAIEWLPKESAPFRNSGAQAIILAECWGAARILLTGFDMQGRHWHADHPGSNPFNKYPEWMRGLEMLAQEIAPPIINCTRETAVQCFPRMTLEQAIENTVGLQGVAAQ